MYKIVLKKINYPPFSRVNKYREFRTIIKEESVASIEVAGGINKGFGVWNLYDCGTRPPEMQTFPFTEHGYKQAIDVFESMVVDHVEGTINAWVEKIIET